MTTPKITDLHKAIEALTQKCAQLEERQRWIERVFESYGVKGLWLSPGKAEPLLGVSRARIVQEIDRAEAMRMKGLKGDLEYGEHYRNIQDPNVDKASWQIHIANFDAVLRIPPDRRRVG